MNTIRRIGLMSILALQLTGPGRAADDEITIVRHLMDEIDAAPRPFHQVDPHEVHGARRWLLRTATRLDEYIRATPRREQVRDWPSRFDVDELLRQLNSARPDRARLWELHRKLGDDSESPEDDDLDLGYHVVRSVRRALRAYLILLDDVRDPSTAQERLDAQREQLVNQMREYLRLCQVPQTSDTEVLEETQRAKHQQLKRIHRTVNLLRERRQLPQLTEKMRRHYLHPILRVHVSERLLNVATDFQLDPFPITRTEDGVRIRGHATTRGGIRVDTQPDCRFAVLKVGLDGSVVFRGTAVRRRLPIGLNVGIDVGFAKRFFIIQRGLDSARVTADVRLRYVDTTCCRLIDGLVERAVRNRFQGDQIGAKIETAVESTAVALRNLVSLRQLPGVSLLSSVPTYARERQYGSTDTSAEFILLSAREGFHDPFTLPVVDPSTDFAVSLHESVLEAMVSLLDVNESKPRSLANVRDWILRRIEVASQLLPAATGHDIQIWFPRGEQLLFFHDGQMQLNFLARVQSEPEKDPYICVFHLSALPAKDGVVLAKPDDAKVPQILEIVGGGDDQNDRDQFRNQVTAAVSDLTHWSRTILPRLQNLPVSGQSHWEDVRKVPLIQLQFENRYVTLTGRLESHDTR